MIKVIHIKSQESVALPIYHSELSHLFQPEEENLTKAPDKRQVSLVLFGFKIGHI